MNPDLANTLLTIAGEHAFPSLGLSILYLVGIVFFLLLNAFFVASEFAIVKVRPSQIEAQAKENGGNPKLALHVVNHLDGYLSANQLGITISSLALGFLGEPFVKALVSPVLAYTGMPEKGIYWTSLILAYTLFTFLHVVVGELVPKSLAIRKSLLVTTMLVTPLHLFFKCFHWVIVFFNSTANWVLKTFFRIEPVSESEHSHSAEELALLVTQSGKSQEVTETEALSAAVDQLDDFTDSELVCLIGL